ncbi:RNA cap guanine-N2 methyltransferase-domain-containing protein [Paraphysoderma sedebokerense]|nr:RNA cap guanine-N2 methyltransferase-domain-containing protein [Paraphysoderma sedebokerense]
MNSSTPGISLLPNRKRKRSNEDSTDEISNNLQAISKSESTEPSKLLEPNPTPKGRKNRKRNRNRNSQKSTIPFNDAFRDPEFKFSEILPKTCTNQNQVSKRVKKYWYNRFKLFEKFDQGICLDEEGWFSVTPENIAAHIAERCRGDVIIDAFAGVGGNAIQFAFTCERVIAIDKSPIRLACLKRNAQVYGVEDRIECILGDFFELAKSRRLKADVVFLSPPWGGPEYLNADTFGLQMIPCDGSHLLNVARTITPNIAYFLPRNLDLTQLPLVTPPGAGCEVEENYLFGKLTSLTVYWGDMVGCRRWLEAGAGQTDEIEVTQGIAIRGSMTDNGKVINVNGVHSGSRDEESSQSSEESESSSAESSSSSSDSDTSDSDSTSSDSSSSDSSSSSGSESSEDSSDDSSSSDSDN